MSLDIKKFKIKYVLLILLSLTIVVISVLLLSKWDSNIWLIFAVITLNSSLFALFYALDVVQFSSISYFLRGGYIFTLFITTTYSIALIGMFQEFPFTCEWLHGASNKLIEFVEKPFTFSVSTIDSLKSKWDWTASLEDPEEIVTLDEKVKSVLLKAKNTDVAADSGTIWTPIMLQFNEWKSNAIDQIIWQQESYNVWMCDMLLEEINAKYDLKEFRLSAILLTYLLLFWFVRVAFFIMSFIWFLVFKVLYWVGLYKIVKVEKIVDEIK